MHVSATVRDESATNWLLINPFDKEVNSGREFGAEVIYYTGKFKFRLNNLRTSSETVRPKAQNALQNSLKSTQEIFLRNIP